MTKFPIYTSALFVRVLDFTLLVRSPHGISNLQYVCINVNVYLIPPTDLTIN